MLHPRLRKAAARLEKQTAADMRGRVTPGSGCVQNVRLKGDVITKHFRVECKLTQAASYSLKLAVLDKIEREALSNCQCPLMSLEIGQQRYAVLRWQDFEAIANDAKMV